MYFSIGQPYHAIIGLTACLLFFALLVWFTTSYLVSGEKKRRQLEGLLLVLAYGSCVTVIVLVVTNSPSFGVVIGALSAAIGYMAVRITK